MLSHLYEVCYLKWIACIKSRKNTTPVRNNPTTVALFKREFKREFSLMTKNYAVP